MHIAPPVPVHGATPITRRALAPDLARGLMLLLIALAHAHMYLSGHEAGFRGYARAATLSGEFNVFTLKPGRVPDGEGGLQAPHIDVSVFARGLLDRVVTRIYFADEAEALFGIRPELRPLASYDPVLAEIDALLPGPGSLSERVTAFRADYVIPRDRLQ